MMAPAVLVALLMAVSQPSIGLLLIAVDAQRDHLRVSEALRIANPGSPTVLDLRLSLPEGAQFVTFHRGLVHPMQTAAGFADRLPLRTGITDVVYSYALPSRRRTQIDRDFPLAVQRMEVVVRGRGVRLAVTRGRGLSPLVVGEESLPRWEVAKVTAGDPITITLDALPVSNPWWPYIGAGALGVVLSALFLAALRRSIQSAQSARSNSQGL